MITSPPGVGLFAACTLAVDHDVLRGGQGERYRIEDAHVADAYRIIEVVGDIGLDLDEALGGELLGHLAQGLVDRLVTFADHAEAGTRRREEATVLVEHYEPRVRPSRYV